MYRLITLMQTQDENIYYLMFFIFQCEWNQSKGYESETIYRPYVNNSSLCRQSVYTKWTNICIIYRTPNVDRPMSGGLEAHHWPNCTRVCALACISFRSPSCLIWGKNDTFGALCKTSVWTVSNKRTSLCTCGDGAIANVKQSHRTDKPFRKGHTAA